MATQTFNGSQNGNESPSSFAAAPPPLSPFGSYPNPLAITKEERLSFHPVMKFPIISVEEENADGTIIEKQVPNVRINDHTNTTPTSSTKQQLATEEQREERRRQRRQQEQELVDAKQAEEGEANNYTIGRYDENRVSMYCSDLFEDLSNEIDGYAGARTVHVGIDLEGPVGTNIYAFTDGKIHSVGYNPELGDYGNVIVIEHLLPASKAEPDKEQQQQQQQQQSAVIGSSTTNINTEGIVDSLADTTTATTSRKVWALYGHLDHESTQGKEKGQLIEKGQAIGRLGDIDENGGWMMPHVHFQLSINEPETHDMPGAVSVQDRPKALFEYFDPRYIVGPLH